MSLTGFSFDSLNNISISAVCLINNALSLVRWKDNFVPKQDLFWIQISYERLKQPGGEVRWRQTGIEKFENSISSDAPMNTMFFWDIFIFKAENVWNLEFISTKGALRLPLTYDNHPIHPSVHPHI